MRIVSLLPSATEIVHAIGLGNQLVGVTHECDYPPSVQGLPRLTSNLLGGEMASADIDRAVSASLKEDAHTIYGLDLAQLAALAPDVILTQALCEVCAVPTSMVEEAVCTMPRSAAIVSLDPLSLDAVFASIEQAGDALGEPEAAAKVASRCRADIAHIAATVAGSQRPRVLAAEWLDPVYCGGHWVPEMISVAGGVDPFGTAGEPSHQLPWEHIVDADPDIIVLMPCGFNAGEVASRYSEIAASDQFLALRAVRELNVYAVDATSYFSRPGPRLVDGTRILARLLHPDRAVGLLPADSVLRLTQNGSFDSVS